MRVARIGVPAVLVVGAIVGALAWVSSRFHGVRLAFDENGGGGPCVRLADRVLDELDRVAVTPLWLLAIALAAMSALVAWIVSQRLSRRGSVAAAATLALSAVAGGLQCSWAYAPADGFSVMAIWFIGLIAIFLAAIALPGIAALTPKPGRRLPLAGIWATAVAQTLVVPLIVADLTPTGQALIC
ncbi:hypothetical protein AB0L40_16550 [Patulibacter sp. NPDC049589]|uniref:hypothetical protein n=1 Tax=Patulibacter sp. NPDC049589 TaxID=3154731 RepID=UPI003423CDAC